MFSRVLILSPHTDDGELGCGATIAKWSAAGSEVTCIAFSSCRQSLPEGLEADTLVRECGAATAALGIRGLRVLDFEVRRFTQYRQEILEVLVALSKTLQPRAVLLPAAGDTHQDHRVIYEEGCRAFRHATLLGYELPWNNTAFSPQYFEPLSEAHLAKKLEALQAYRSQAHRKYMKEDFIRALARVRGVQSGGELAEAFEIYRYNGHQ